MSIAYAAWIECYVARCGGPEATLGRCESAAKEMAAACPELTVTAGHVMCPEPWGRRGHWWCTAPDGSIVDPTRGQFPFFDEELSYEPYVEGADVRLGRCMDCGESIWGPASRGYQQFCDESCERSFGASLMGGL